MKIPAITITILSFSFAFGQSTIESEILAVNREMEKIFNEGTYSKVAEQYYTSDAVMVGSKKEVNGLNDIIFYWENFEGDLTWKLESIEIRSLGKGYALQRGYSNILYPLGGGETGTSRSVFSLIWKQTDQGWKMMLDHFSPR